MLCIQAMPVTRYESQLHSKIEQAARRIATEAY